MSFCLIVFQIGSLGRHTHILEFEIKHIVVVSDIMKGL